MTKRYFVHTDQQGHTEVESEEEALDYMKFLLNEWGSEEGESPIEDEDLRNDFIEHMKGVINYELKHFDLYTTLEDFSNFFKGTSKFEYWSLPQAYSADFDACEFCGLKDTDRTAAEFFEDSNND